LGYPPRGGGGPGGAGAGGAGGGAYVRTCVRACVRACVHAPFDLPPIALTSIFKHPGSELVAAGSWQLVVGFISAICPFAP
jgi:hypothetical protein